MIVRSSIRRTHYLSSPGILLMLLLAAWPASAQQPSTNGIGFWDVPEPRMNAMLKEPPYHEADRLARLRGYFTEFGCTGDRLTETTPELLDRHKVLLCTLPGQSTRRILVYSFYPHTDILNGAADGWPEAVALPMLYKALQAQPRRFTFVFAEFSGQHPLLNLLKQWRSEDSPPVALIAVSTLGLGATQFTAIPSDALPAAARPNADVTRTEAWSVAWIMHLDVRRSSVPSAYSNTPGIEIPAFTPEGAKGIPGIVVYSSPVLQPGQVAAQSQAHFRVDHDFLAYYLADLDTKLDGSL